MELNGMNTHPMIDPACARGHHYVRDGVRCSSCGAVAAPVLPTMPGSVQYAGHRRAVPVVRASRSGGIRTVTDMLLRHVPLPLGYRSKC